MSLIDFLPLASKYEKREAMPELDAPVIEWMRQMEDWRDRVIQAEAQFHTANDEGDAYLEYGEKIKQIDEGVGEYATHVAAEPAITFEANGFSRDKTNVWNPGERFIIQHALEIFKHIRTDNSRALLEALFSKYSDERWWPETKNYIAKFEQILEEHEELRHDSNALR